MKLLLLLIISASLLIGLAKSDDPLKDMNGCKVPCLMTVDFCDVTCKINGGSSGYCKFSEISCWCKGLPDNKIWKNGKNCYSFM
uniref:Sodium channel blocker AbNaTx11 n=1 Tax=Androctonus bicolor TaxID=748906 RepID=A0A0K0LBT5_9SCOR|nr:sodium channel blocker AbNaTx11 [Androctonus bicolor]